MHIGEVIFFTIFIGLLLGGWFFMNGTPRVFWLTTFSIILLDVVIAEIVATLTKGQTISQMFWEFSLAYPVRGWIIIGMLAGAFFLLLWHLGTKLIAKI